MKTLWARSGEGTVRKGLLLAEQRGLLVWQIKAADMLLRKLSPYA